LVAFVVLWPRFAFLVGILYAVAMVPVYQWVCSGDGATDIIKVLFSEKLQDDYLLFLDEGRCNAASPMPTTVEQIHSPKPFPFEWLGETWDQQFAIGHDAGAKGLVEALSNNALAHGIFGVFYLHGLTAVGVVIKRIVEDMFFGSKKTDKAPDK
jgi:hypothetical protein